MKSITVVFVNYHSQQQIHKNILIFDKVPVKIYVCDNSGEYQKIDNEIIFQSKTNIGYVGGNNSILYHDIINSTDWILICNSDLSEIEWLKIFELLYVTKSKVISFRGPNRPHNGFYWDILKKYFNVEVPSVYGCLFAIDKEIFKKNGGFNHEYFMYSEEHELSIRLLKQGIDIYEDSLVEYQRPMDENFRFSDWKWKLKVINNLSTINSHFKNSIRLKLIISRLFYEMNWLVRNKKPLNLYYLFCYFLAALFYSSLSQFRQNVIQSKR